MGFNGKKVNPLEPAVLGKGSPGSLLKVWVPPFGKPVATLYRLQSFDHSRAVADHTTGLAFFQGPDNR
eukprot:4724112-Amphidinium_carterae.1